jgi:hypothetical protein
MRWFAELHSTRWMRVAFRAALIVSLLAITEVVRGVTSLVSKSLGSLRVGPFFFLKRRKCGLGVGCS